MRKRPPLADWLRPNTDPRTPNSCPRPAKRKRAKPVPYESRHQSNVIQTLYHEYREVYELTFAIPNGGGRDGFEAKHLQEEGVKAGVPDLMIAYPSGIYHGLFIEMKRLPTEGKGKPIVSLQQKEWHTKLRNAGYAVYVCYGYDEAMRVIKTYLNLDCFRYQQNDDI